MRVDCTVAFDQNTLLHNTFKAAEGGGSVGRGEGRRYGGGGGGGGGSSEGNFLKRKQFLYRLAPTEEAALGSEELILRYQSPTAGRSFSRDVCHMICHMIYLETAAHHRLLSTTRLCKQ